MKQLIISILLILALTYQVQDIASLIHPIKSPVVKQNQLQIAAIEIGIGDPGVEALKAVEIAASQTGLSEPFLLVLMFTESSFDPKAVSKKNYRGLMQIPYPVYYHDANMLIGARIFLEKLKITKGDYRKAIIIYKGWPMDHPEGIRQADKVLNLTKKIKERV